jgi:hypothetical protein
MLRTSLVLEPALSPAHFIGLALPTPLSPMPSTLPPLTTPSQPTPPGSPSWSLSSPKPSMLLSLPLCGCSARRRRTTHPSRPRPSPAHNRYILRQRVCDRPSQSDHHTQDVKIFGCAVPLATRLLRPRAISRGVRAWSTTTKPGRLLY